MRSIRRLLGSFFFCLALTSGLSAAQEVTGTDLLLIERECQRLGVLYTHYVDFGKAERIAELFADDGVWESGSTRAEGKAEVRDLFRRRQDLRKRVSRHVVTNHLVEVLGPEHARGVSYFVLFRHDDDPSLARRPLADQPVFVGEYEDEYVRTDDGWRFKSRKASGTFVRQDESR